MSRNLRQVFYRAVIFASIGLLDAQVEGGIREPLTTDRPGIGDGVKVIGAGYLQFESGLTLTGRSDGGSAERSFTGGSPLVRWGIGHGIELRFAADGFRSSAQRADSAFESVVTRTAGPSDLSAGAKVGLVQETAWRPELAVVAMVSMPAGDPRFSSSGVDPTVKLVWSKSIRESTVVGGNFLVSSLSAADGRFSREQVSVQVSRGLRRQWNAFTEAYLARSSLRGSDTVWALDAGVSHPLGPNAQVDVSAGQQIAPLIRCWFVSAGLVVRFPAHR